MSNYLCEDLIVEIFTRIPPKSLLRFRSLSKFLYCCISSPGFIRMHASRSPQKIRFVHLTIDENKERRIFFTLHGEDDLALCLCPTRGYIGTTTKVPHPQSTFFGDVGSCNGTFCFWTKPRYYSLILYNPSIRRKVNLPECPEKYEPGLHGIGFGFDPVSDDFKIVMISCAKDTSFVYAVKMGAWCEIASVKPKFTCVGFSHAYLFNGVLHWKVCNDPSKSQETNAYILTFDLSTHVFGMIPLPAPTPHWKIQELTTIQGSLALISYASGVGCGWIWIWRDASWSVVFKFNFPDQVVVVTETVQLKSLVTNALQLQGTTNNGDLLLQLNSGDNLQVYNSTTGVHSRVVDFDVDTLLRDFRPCIETLHLIDTGETTCETEEL